MVPQVRNAHPFRRETEFDKALSACWSAFWILALFSFAINILLMTQPLYMLQVYDRVLSTGHVETLIMLTAIAGGALLLLGTLDMLRAAVTVRMGCWLNDRLGPVYLAAGVRARLQGENVGAQPLRDLNQVQNFVASQGLTVFFDAPWAPVFIVLIWLLHPMLGMLALVSAVVLLGLTIANDLLTRKSNLTANVAQISATQQAEAAIRNAEVVYAMGMLPAVLQRWQESNASAQRAVRSSAELGGILTGLTKFVRFFVQVAVLGLGAWLVLQSELTAGGMIASSILLGRALAPVELAMSVWRNFSAARISYSRLKSYLQNFPEQTERTRLPTPVGNLTVDNLTYVLPQDRRPILRQISFKVQPGEAVAVIGPSAGGKSTLCRMIVGLAIPSAGHIRLDGSRIDHWDPDQLGQYIGYLPQDVELFSGTVRENIARLGPADDESVIGAAMLAHAHELIQHLPDGYDTQIGDGGARLSGGQRQRIGLARAVYGNPRLVILDEPNANLDQAGESALAATLNLLKQQGTALIIVGHRPSTLAQADKILLLKDGAVELFGPREKVLQTLREIAANNGKNGAVPIQRPSSMPQSDHQNPRENAGSEQKIAAAENS
ncbi:type I secretion system permease/ATPase [Microvirga subterranea]|uniref:ATP-binding cassette subfamily C protein/ATP-binding cassette subfamily C exporter for protease/lipase/ATP-binding cassette subfamily C protein EexD n=1 Tax=Microvirga subterranea TaxID=186651 RepID=A0A370HR59_9HYPH|nr:type I secretion system permease/ATPase [Microvirga subterranea]RDI60780.1 ATP-binding cassette subfamily C protein/ATP-binding cassette subfamily C exporter for protease/lipase/ATP-binding cassette subfamily C protein EexD [Microvirga subterranea]